MALRLVDEPKKKRTLQAELERNLKGALKRQGTLNIGFPGGNADEVVYSAGEGTLWVAFGPPNKDTAIPRFWGRQGRHAGKIRFQGVTMEETRGDR
jgi:hypothetical protein